MARHAEIRQKREYQIEQEMMDSDFEEKEKERKKRMQRKKKKQRDQSRKKILTFEGEIDNEDVVEIEEIAKKNQSLI